MPDIAFITGVRGQDGSYLADLLLDKGYEVHGMVRRHSNPQHPNISHLHDTPGFHLHQGDLTDQGSIERILQQVYPTEVYNLGAQSNVGESFNQPTLTFDVTGRGAYRVFEAVRKHCPTAKVYQASSSEQYGQVATTEGIQPLNEEAPFRPVSPYAAAKTFAHGIAHTYRVAHDLDIWCGILFNHESPRRGRGFVTRKITINLALIAHGYKDGFELGNLQAMRDWGYAPEYVEGMWRMLQTDEPQDYVLATGESWTVRDFLEEAYLHAQLPEPLDAIVDVGEQNFRPADIPKLVGNASKAIRGLGWEPEVGFPGLAARMVEADMQRVENEKITSYNEE